MYWRIWLLGIKWNKLQRILVKMTWCSKAENLKTTSRALWRSSSSSIRRVASYIKGENFKILGKKSIKVSLKKKKMLNAKNWITKSSTRKLNLLKSFRYPKRILSLKWNKFSRMQWKCWKFKSSLFYVDWVWMTWNQNALLKNYVIKLSHCWKVKQKTNVKSILWRGTFTKRNSFGLAHYWRISL